MPRDIDLSSISENLDLHDDGIWYARQREDVSYPDEGNDLCLQLEENSFWFRHRNDCIVAVVRKFSPDAVLLDVGGGNGFVSRSLEQAGIDCVLLEPGQRGASNGKQRGLKNVVCATIGTCGIKPGAVEAIGLFDVVEHMKDDADFLKANGIFLKECGYLYLTVPSIPWLWSREDVYAGHFRRYTLKSLEKTLQGAGFEMVYSTFLFSALIVPIFLFRVLPSRLGCAPGVADISQYKREHNRGGASILEQVWRRELRRITMGKSIPWGSSILAVARRVGS